MPTTTKPCKGECCRNPYGTCRYNYACQHHVRERLQREYIEAQASASTEGLSFKNRGGR